ncbi:hypothetical protein [Streptomyces sp. NPDC056479]|uniref:hypothetical protein n=1 Tax=unclassified Streptomyces TaxID=2593676 RepID=UPI00369E289F
MSLPPGSPGTPVRAPVGDEARYGSSFLLEDGDLVISTSGARGELKLVHGLPNLQQALVLRLLTPYGSDQVNATYGLDVRRALTGDLGRRAVKDLIRLEVVRTLATDPRVREVTDVVFDDDPQFAAQTGSAVSRPADRRNGGRRAVVTVETVQDTTTLIPVDLMPVGSSDR